jgi:DNA-binding transcriptional MerR regulator
MNFREATDNLFSRISHQDLARALGVSIASIRQARLNQRAGAHRAPPPNWKDAIARIAEKRIAHYRKLIAQLNQEGDDRQQYSI